MARDLMIAALAPAVWGSTYLVTTEFLPPNRPLLTATLRALPVGLLLALRARELPSGAWWWRSAVLGVLNIGAFFALLFVAAYRLPGGVAATAGAIQPLVVASLAWLLLGETVRPATALAGATGVVGVGSPVSASSSPPSLCHTSAPPARKTSSASTGRRGSTGPERLGSLTPEG